MPVEAGPDGFLARAPEAADLCRSLGLDEHLVAPAPGPTDLWSRNRLGGSWTVTVVVETASTSYDAVLPIKTAERP